MKKLLLLALLLPLIPAYAFLTSDDDDKAIVIRKHDGKRVAVRALDVSNVEFSLADTIDSRCYILDKDTIWLTDTLLLHDTTYVYEPKFVQISLPEHRYHQLENPTAEAFLNDFDYPDNNYNFSSIDNYLQEETPYSKERPLGVELRWSGEGEKLLLAEDYNFKNAQEFSLPEDAECFVVNNLIPGRRYFWKVTRGNIVVASDRFSTLGRVRMVNVESIHNVRDIGGMATSDGRRTAYGRIFRGGDLTHISDNDRRILLDSLGIRAEMDVIQANNLTTSPTLGESVDYASVTGQNINRIPYPSYYGATYAATLRHILRFLSEGKPVYLHCGGGADRTGAIAILLEGLAGCNESDIAKDYEMTSFSIYGRRMRTNGVVYDGTTYNYYTTIRYLRNLANGNLQQGVETYLGKIGMTGEETEQLRSLLLE